jgi:hypothetical protein
MTMAKSDKADEPVEEVEADEPVEEVEAEAPVEDAEPVGDDQEVEASIDAIETDAKAELRVNIQEAHDAEVAVLEEKLARAMAIAAPVQKVIDPNEAAALKTLTGQKPERDTSEAPEPGVLGAHNNGLPTTADTPLP